MTERSTILVFNWCYHGTVDETFATLGADGVVRARSGNLGPPVDPAVTTRVVEFNDVDALERELAHGDVALVLAEPALTNIGIVHPEPGFHDALRELTRRHGTLLAIDETHTICCGPGGYTQAHGLEPDVVTIGKPIAGGIPAAAYGFSEEVAARLAGRIELEDVDVGGVGGTLAGERALARRDARDARRGAHGGGVRADDPARRAVDGGRGGRHRRVGPAVARDAPRLSCGVSRSGPIAHGTARRPTRRRMPRSSATCTSSR